MDLGLQGERALVLGGTAGLGLACASRLSDAGVRVIINGRDRTRGEAAVRALPQGELVVADIGREDERRALIEAVTGIGAPSIIVTTPAARHPDSSRRSTHRHGVRRSRRTCSPLSKSSARFYRR